jgi:hypothetical protein
MRFHLLPGNHDMWGVGGKHSATRILAADGGTRLLTSDPRLAAAEAGAILAPGLRVPGQAAALAALGRFAPVRQQADLHWESPFGPDDRWAARTHPVTARDGSVTHTVLDTSCLVEPAAGLWLLLLDANVWEPRPGIAEPSRKRAFLEPGDAGWDGVERVKPWLLDWIAGVAGRARAAGKALVAVSHYPLRDPVGAAGSGLGHLGDATLARRTPRGQAAARLAAAGLSLHLAGHLHLRGESRAAGLLDVAVPSPVAWPPGFAVVHPEEGRVEQVSLADLPADPALAERRATQGAPEAPTLGAHLAAQARARAATRLLPHDWPPALAALLSGSLAEACAALGAPAPDLAAHAGADLAADWHLLRHGATAAEAAIPPDRARGYARLAAVLRDESDPALAGVIRALARLTA